MLVKKVVNENAVIWNDFIAFNEGATDFSKVITNIQAERQKQEQNYKGVRVDKKETVIALIHLTLKHVSAIKVYALMNKEHALLQKISYSKSKIQKLDEVHPCFLLLLF